ncbi:MAG: hypothetical protein JNM13_13205 [Hyphomicrobiaceae bacterium]|nr:hypothetical protein [Hyphomicrobiaceae bacterium]
MTSWLKGFAPKGRLAIRTGSIAIAAALVAGCASNSSFDDGSSSSASESPERAVIGRIMGGLGAVDTRQEAIEYKPRSPLVVPPNRDLRSPVEADPGATAANWPRDPDVADRERRQRAASMQGLDPSRNWTPEELKRYNAAQGFQTREQEELQRQSLLDPDFKDASKPLKPDQLKGNPILTSGPVDAKGQPIRKRGLTDPPGSYMTPSPNAPVAIPESEKKAWPLWPF